MLWHPELPSALCIRAHSCLWALTMNHMTAITVLGKELVEQQCATCCMDFRRTSRKSTVLCTRVHVKLHMMITKCNTANKFQPDTATVTEYNTANIKPAFRGVMANLGTGNSSPVQNTPHTCATIRML